MFAGFEGALRERVVRLVGSGDGDEAEGIDGEKFVEGADDAGIGIELRGGVAGALKNCGEAQAGNGVDHRCVETAAAQAKTDEAHIDHFAFPSTPHQRLCVASD